MNIKPIATGQASGQPGANIGAVEVGRSSSSDKLNRAKSIASGEPSLNIQPSDTPVDPQVERLQRKRTIKMQTNVSPDRIYNNPIDEPIESATVDDTVQAISATEDTKPISPQLAALARQKRALQVKERELAEREAKLTAAPANGSVVELSKLEADPLSVLQEHGILTDSFYNALTEQLLTNQGNPEILALKAEIKALKEGVDKQLSDRDSQTEQQVYADMQREATQLINQGDNYEMIRETNSMKDVMELIRRTWKSTGEVLDVQSACDLVENELLDEGLKIANIKKVQSKVSPSPASNQQLQPQQRQMRTLTNRDSAAPTMDRRARAIAAALGQLKK